MSYQKSLAVVLVTFFSFLPALGLNFTRWGSKKYEMVGSEVMPEKITKMLDKSSLSKKKQRTLASYCEKYPADCTNRRLFTKIDPNLLFDNGDAVLREYLRHLQTGEAEFAALISEAFKNKALNPHLKSNGDGDLALDILRGDDFELIKALVTHESFDPNYRYGNTLVPLATQLIQSKSYKALDFVLKHQKFANDVADNDHNRPGLYLLEDSAHCDQFAAFMGTSLINWNLSGLGLNNANRLDILLQFVLKNEEDRLFIFKKYIEQILLPHEVLEPAQKDAFSAVSLLFGLKDLGSVVYIDKSFMQQALRLLVSYSLLKDRMENNVHPSVFWSEDAIRELSTANIASVRKAYQEHLVTKHEKACTLCLEEDDGTWIKTSKWCDHASCSKCWLGFVEAVDEKKDTVCPVRDCGVLVPPSLYLALTAEVLEDDNGNQSLQDAYERQFVHHRTFRQAMIEGVPNLKTCTACNINFIYDNKLPKPRKLACPACKALHIITDGPNGKFTSITTTGTWGYCSECKTLIDKPEGCNAVSCVVCQKGTTFIPIY